MQVFFLEFFSSLYLWKVYEFVLLRFYNFFCVEVFLLPKESKKNYFFAPMFYSFQNLVVHWVALTMNNLFWKAKTCKTITRFKNKIKIPTLHGIPTHLLKGGSFKNCSHKEPSEVTL
jgi:hypothetical protein